jgi:hypothetical protein
MSWAYLVSDSHAQVEANLVSLAYLADWVSLEGWRNNRKEERNYREWLAREAIYL